MLDHGQEGARVTPTLLQIPADLLAWFHAQTGEKADLLEIRRRKKETNMGNALARQQPLDETEVLTTLAARTYEETAQQYGISRGKVYSIALAHNARKHEQRIAERKAERLQRQRELLETMLGTTQKADVLDYLEALPSTCADLVITSIPYNVSVAYGGHAGADAMPHLYYIGWMTMVISEMARITKPGGVVFLQCGTTKDDDGALLPLDVLLFETLRKAGLTYQNRVTWLIPHGLTPKRRLSGRYETALIFSKGEPATFHPTPGRTPQKQPDKRAFKGPNKGKLSGHPFGAWPSDVWQIGNIGHNHPEKTGHPAQFPEEMVRRAVEMYTNPDELVIDPFSGSGTAQAVCVRTQRRFAGADLYYAEMANERAAGVEPDSYAKLPGVSDQSAAVWQAEARHVGLTGREIAQQMQASLL